MAEHDYLLLDVFTDTPLAGNPLAIMMEADGLDDSAMQAIAREFNLSETVFVLKPDNPAHTARIRIFTPAYEMPFAGHPTVGTAVALAAGSTNGGQGPSIVTIEENLGLFRCVVTGGEGPAFAEFDLPALPARLPFDVGREQIAAALGLNPHEIGFENHEPSLNSAGVPYVAVPVAGLEAAAKVRVDGGLWSAIAPSIDGKIACAYVYCRETVGHDMDWHARMFVVGEPSYEDPATGSAAAAFGSVIMGFDEPLDGDHRIWIEQGLEMGRPSRLRLELAVEGGVITGARIGGHAIRIASGRLML
ncbi:MAG: PhzF family phenazine biosynthesis protein [Rhizobiaceae bacterium]|nr:PhzF family phenazine biosynthesis protein [Rhizobiaceae bacterium]MCV0406284.1 PhzF family phenazine biosynthesis protein [Rhizobiaceae bacterium]